MSCSIKVNSNTIELTMHTSCYCILDLLCVNCSLMKLYMTSCKSSCEISLSDIFFVFMAKWLCWLCFSNIFWGTSMLLVLFFLFMGHLMTSFLLPAGRSLDCLLLEPGLKPQSLSSGIWWSTLSQSNKK